MPLDAVNLLNIGGNLVEIGQDYAGLIAVTGKADPGIGMDCLQAVLHGALLFVI